MMKTLLAILLFLSFAFTSKAEELPATYQQFKHAVCNMPIVEQYDHSPVPTLRIVWKPAIILFATFCVNHIILLHDERNGDWSNTSIKLGTIFIMGGTISFIIFLHEVKQHERQQSW